MYIHPRLLFFSFLKCSLHHLIHWFVWIQSVFIDFYFIFCFEVLAAGWIWECDIFWQLSWPKLKSQLSSGLHLPCEMLVYWSYIESYIDTWSPCVHWQQGRLLCFVSLTLCLHHLVTVLWVVSLSEICQSWGCIKSGDPLEPYRLCGPVTIYNPPGSNLCRTFMPFFYWKVGLVTR